MKKKLISILLCVAMSVAVFSGCGSEDGKTNETVDKEVDKEASQQPSEDAEIEVVDEPLEFSWVVYNQMGIMPNPDSEAKKFLEEKYNIKINIELVDIHDSGQMGLYWASGSTPDVIYFNNAGASTLNDLIDQGILRSIPEGYLDEYMPDYMEAVYELLGEETTMGQISLGTGDAYVVPYTYTYWPYIMGIRQDWLDNLGLKMPTNNEELFEVIKAFTFDDPDGNGVDDTYGLSANINYGANVGFGYPMFSTGMVPNSFYKQEDGSVIYSGTTDAYKDVLKMYNTWYDAGVIDPEFTTDDRAMQRDKWVNGKLGIVVDDANWWLPTGANNLINILKKVNPDAEVSFIEPFKDKNGVGRVMWTLPNVASDGCLAFGSECSDEVIKKVLEIKNDLAVDKDFYLRMRYGIEGKDFELVDGAVKASENSVTPEALTENGTGQTFALIPETEMLMSLSFNETDLELWRWANSFELTYYKTDFIAYGTNEAMSNYGTDVKTITNEFYFNAITGAVDIDAEWDNYVKALEDANVQLICQEYEDMLKQ